MNIIGMLCLFLQAAVLPPSALVVKSPDKSVTLSVVASESGPMVSAKKLSEAVGGSLKSSETGRFIFTIGNRQIEITPGTPYVRTDSAGLVSLTSAPAQISGELFLPWQLVSRVLPTLAPGLKYEDSLVQLTVSPELFASEPATPLKPAGSAATAPRAPPSKTAAAPKPAQDATSVSAPKKKRLIVVDPGHGGVDPGMRGPIGARNKIQEKHITLAVSLLIEKHLKEAGFDVLLTRRKDTLIALADRGRIANRAGGDLFLSVHVNAVNRSAVRGFETYFLAEAKTAEAARVEQMENEVVRFETEVEAPAGNDPLSFILKDMAQNEHLRESNEFAQFVQDEMAVVHPGPNRGVQQANFAVLRGSYMPAILIELGFGSNPTEAKFLSDPASQNKLAQQISKAVQKHMAKYEARLKAGSQ